VPYGKFDPAKIPWPTRKEMRAASAVLRNIDITNDEWIETVLRARRGDLIYADPPYLGTFDGYTGRRFTIEDHRDLARNLRQLNENGVHVAVSNSNAPEVKEMYGWARVELMGRARNIAQQGDDRGLGVEILAWREAR
jgi:DNA adenine methylase